MTDYARYEATIQDELGNIVTGATVEVRRESDNGIATLYNDRTGASPLANSFVCTDGNLAFHVTGGAYKITVTKGSFSRVRRWVGIGTASEFDFTSGTTNYAVRYTSASAFGPSSILYDDGTGVAIGHASPAALFSIKGPGASYINAGQLGGNSTLTGFDFAGSSRVVGTGTYNIIGGDGNTYINAPSGGSLLFRINNASVGLWNTTGLAVGHASPGAVLDVKNVAAESASGQEVLRLRATMSGSTTGAGPYLSFSNGSELSRIQAIYTSGIDLAFFNWSGSASVEYMRLKSGGAFGIGTTTPGNSGLSEKLTVVGAIVSQGSGPINAALTSGSITGSTAGVGAVSNHPFIIFTNATERARFDISGNFVIGSTSSVGRITSVSATADVTNIVALSGSSGARTGFAFGRTTNEGVFGVEAVAGSSYAGSTPGDVFFGAVSGGGNMHIGTYGVGYPAIFVKAGSAGNVGVEGQTDPKAPLAFFNGTGEKINLYYGTSTSRYGFGVQSALFQQYASDVGDSIAWGYGSSASFTEWMRLKGGNLALGVTALGTSAAKTLALANGTKPTTAISGIQLTAVSGVAKLVDGSNNTISLDTHLLRDDTSATLAKGFYETPFSNGTVSSGTLTPDAANGNKQYYTNGGAHTLAPPSSASTIEMEITNNGSAGAITTSGFTKVTGDAFDTTNAHKFICIITKTQTYSLLNVVALQ